MSSATSPFLISGATGRHGGTGQSVAASLLRHGGSVRVLTRRPSEQTDRLHRLGAEVVTGDFHDRRSLAPALSGVRSALFVYPVAGGIVDAAASFASAARAAGVERIVVMSMGAAHPDSPSPLGRAQWLAEEVLEWAGFSCVQLRVAAFFFENLDVLHRVDIERDGVLRNSFGDVAVNWMAGEDAAKLAVAALLHPDRFGDARAVYPTGKYRYSHGEVARILGAHLGRALRHVTIARDAWEQHLMELAARDPRINADMARHISSLATMRTAIPPNDLFERLTGEAQLSLEDALASGRLSFA